VNRRTWLNREPGDGGLVMAMFWAGARCPHRQRLDHLPHDVAPESNGFAPRLLV